MKARGAEPDEKEGLDTGILVRNPFTEEDVHLFAGNFVLPDYGTGAVMAVPAHDQRDFEFAQKYGIPIRVVVAPPDEPGLTADELEEAWVDYGVLKESGPFDGMPSVEAWQGGRLAGGLYGWWGGRRCTYTKAGRLSSFARRRRARPSTSIACRSRRRPSSMTRYSPKPRPRPDRPMIIGLSASP